MDFPLSGSFASPVRRAGRWVWASIFSAAALLILFFPVPFASAVPTQRTIRIEASTFQYIPGELQVNPGDQVTIELVSTDVVHGLSLDGYNFNLTAEPGQTVKGTFIANKTGVFRFRCSIPCGNLHPFMIGELKVGPNLLFWRAIALGLLVVGVVLGSFRWNLSA
jgi:heme/copper-type cytochrome/quinol oxidase subunit 2